MPQINLTWKQEGVLRELLRVLTFNHLTSSEGRIKSLDRTSAMQWDAEGVVFYIFPDKGKETKNGTYKPDSRD